MRKITSLTLCALTLLMTNCQNEDVLEDPISIEFEKPAFQVSSSVLTLGGMSAGLNLEGACYSQELIAGQHHTSGTVEVTMADDRVNITYKTSGDWYINATHLYAGDCDGIPETRSGNPKPGVFDHSSSHDSFVNVVEYSIDRTFFEDCFCVAAHAEVVRLDAAGNVVQAETAWADGLDFDGNNWATYFEVCQNDCESLGGGGGSGTL